MTVPSGIPVHGAAPPAAITLSRSSGLVSTTISPSRRTQVERARSAYTSIPRPSGSCRYERLADEVIRCPDLGVDACEVPQQSPQRCPVGQQDREVEQPEMPAAPDRVRAGPFPELDERSSARLIPEHRLARAAREHSQSEDLLVVPDRAVQV